MKHQPEKKIFKGHKKVVPSYIKLLMDELGGLNGHQFNIKLHRCYRKATPPINTYN